MYKSVVLYNHGQVMVEAYGSTRYQAQRNSAVLGLIWLDQNRETTLSWVKPADKIGTSLEFMKM